MGRAEAFLAMNDLHSAQNIAKAALSPHIKESYDILLDIYAKQGNERQLLLLWKEYGSLFPKEAYERSVLETVSWGILNKGRNSSMPLVRLYALFGAGQSQDVRALHHLSLALRGHNEALRVAALQMTPRFRDAALLDEVERLWSEEGSWPVRMELIRAIGQLQMQHLHPLMEQALTHCDQEMQVALTSALTQMSDTLSDAQLESLCASPHPELKALACRISTYLNYREAIPYILPLLSDTVSSVRREALWALSYLQYMSAETYCSLLSDPDPHTALVAAWALALCGEEEGLRYLESFLSHELSDIRLLAAAAIKAGGSYTLSIARKHFISHQDFFVQINLTLAVLREREDLEQGCEQLASLIANTEQRWMYLREHPFSPIAPSLVRHHPLIPRYPEAVHQAIQLELLNFLAVLKYPRAQDCIRRFLQDSPWGITSFASACLLQEGDEEALSLVSTLLNDPDPHTRTQAALILAHWGSDSRALETLKAIYPTANRKLQELILDSLGKLPGQEALPFLTEALASPSQTLRLIAASSLLQTLH